MKRNIEKREGKTGIGWRLEVSFGSNEAGKRLRFKRTIPASWKYGKRDAEKALREFIAELEARNYIADTKDTIGAILDQWIESVEATASVRPKTLEGYRLIVNNYLKPYLSNVKGKDLKPSRVERTYARLRKHPSSRGGFISGRTIHHAHRTLSEALKWSVRRGLMATNPAEFVPPPKWERPEIRTVEPQDMQKIFEYLEHHSPWAITPITIALLTGARRSEILGLRWEDINFRSGSISIQRALSQLRDQSTHIEPTKTASSTRNVVLTDRAKDELRSWRGKQQRTAKKVGLSVRDSDLVFSNPPIKEDDRTWTPFKPSSLSQAFTRACQSLGLEGISMKSLRHTHASTMLEANVHPKVVQERLGHSTITTTLDTYSHVAQGLQEAAAKAFDDAYEVKKPESQPAISDAD